MSTIEKREPMPCAHPNRVVRNISPSNITWGTGATPFHFDPIAVTLCQDCGMSWPVATTATSITVNDTSRA